MLLAPQQNRHEEFCDPTAQAGAAGAGRSSLARLWGRGDLERVRQVVCVLAGADDALPGPAVVSHASAATLHRLGNPPPPRHHGVHRSRVAANSLDGYPPAPDPPHRTRRDDRQGVPASRIERIIADLLSSRRYAIRSTLPA